MTQALKEFTPEELDELEEKYGISDYHLARFLESLRANISGDPPKHFIPTEPMEDPAP